MQTRNETQCQSALSRRDVFLASGALVSTSALGSIALMDVADAQAAASQSAITEQQARAIGVDACLYFYPLITMDLTRKQFTNLGPGKEFGKGPMNMFNSVSIYPPADFKGVVSLTAQWLVGAWWIDGIGSLAIVCFLVKEGREA
jgi:hypothetical protein